MTRGWRLVHKHLLVLFCNTFAIVPLCRSIPAAHNTVTSPTASTCGRVPKERCRPAFCSELLLVPSEVCAVLNMGNEPAAKPRHAAPSQQTSPSTTSSRTTIRHMTYRSTNRRATQSRAVELF